MKWRDAHRVVESLRAETQLYLPPLSKRRGFSSSRVEHLLNRLVQEMPAEESYLEVGTLEGRTLEAAAHANDGKTLFACDPCTKYEIVPNHFAPNVTFFQATWQEFLKQPQAMPIGCVFYDADHSAEETQAFMNAVVEHVADEAVLVLDDWDRVSVRLGAFRSTSGWQLLRECPEYTNGLTTAPHHFGYSFGVAVFGFKR